MLPIRHDQLDAMFPYVAVMAIGALECRTRRPLAGIAARLSGASLDEGIMENPYAELVRRLRHREALAESGASGGRSTGFAGVLGSLFSRNAPRPAA
jgi:hypothetical protein